MSEVYGRPADWGYDALSKLPPVYCSDCAHKTVCKKCPDPEHMYTLCPNYLEAAHLEATFTIAKFATERYNNDLDFKNHVVHSLAESLAMEIVKQKKCKIVESDEGPIMHKFLMSVDVINERG